MVSLIFIATLFEQLFWNLAENFIIGCIILNDGHSLKPPPQFFSYYGTELRS
jgi:hypothetical protein